MLVWGLACDALKAYTETDYTVTNWDAVRDTADCCRQCIDIDVAIHRHPPPVGVRVARAHLWSAQPQTDYHAGVIAPLVRAEGAFCFRRRCSARLAPGPFTAVLNLWLHAHGRDRKMIGEDICPPHVAR